MVGPVLTHTVCETNPTHYVRRMFTGLFGILITPAEMQDEGSPGIFFPQRDPSSRVLGISNDHVLRKDTTVDYKLKGAARQRVRLSDLCRYQRFLTEIKGIIATNITEAECLALNIVRLEEKPRRQGTKVAVEQQETNRADLTQLNK